MIDEVKKGYSIDLVHHDIEYSVSNCLFDLTKNRLLLELRYLPSRKMTKSNEKIATPTFQIPFMLLGLLDLETGKLIQILKEGIVLDKIALTSDYIIQIASEKLYIRDLNSGQVLQELDYSLSKVEHLSTEIRTNAFILTLKDGKILYYDIENARKLFIKESSVAAKSSFSIGKNALFIIVYENHTGEIYKKRADDSFEKISSFSLEGRLKDVHYEKSKKLLFLSTKKKREYTITLYQLKD